MIKIVEQKKTIYLINKQSIFKPREGAILVTIQFADEMRLKYKKLINKKNLDEIYFFNEDIEKLFRYFSRMFRVMGAAGGLVKNKKNKWLFIFRNGKWDLPKGKIEKGESIKAAAIREVGEECGIIGLKITKKVSTTYHTYFLKKKKILKCTYWFEMNCDETSKLVPQTEEGITAVKWIAPNKLKQVLDNTFESIKDLVKEIKKESAKAN